MRHILTLAWLLIWLVFPATAQNAFGDSAPVDFAHPAPQSFPVHGIKAARVQDHIN